MKRLYVLLLTSWAFSFSLEAQVGVNTTSPDPNTMLDVNGKMIIRDVESVASIENTGLMPVFRNTDGTLASSTPSDKYSAAKLEILEGSSTVSTGTLAEWNTANGATKILLQTSTFVLDRAYDMVIIRTEAPLPTCINPTDGLPNATCTNSTTVGFVLKQHVVYELVYTDDLSVPVRSFVTTVSTALSKPHVAIPGKLAYSDDDASLSVVYFFKNAPLGTYQLKVYTTNRGFSDDSITPKPVWYTCFNPARVVVEEFVKL